MGIALGLGAILGILGGILGWSESAIALAAAVVGITFLGWALPNSLAAFRAAHDPPVIEAPTVVALGEPLPATGFAIQIARSEGAPAEPRYTGRAATAVVTAALILTVAQGGSFENERSIPAESLPPDTPATDTHD